MNTPSMLQRVLLLLASVALFSPAIVFSAPGSVQQQLQTAEKHAKFASKADNIDDTHFHLHHVINCLVGPKGKDFNADAGNPCADQGNGALNASGVSMQQRETMQQILTLAKVGSQIKSYRSAHDAAVAVKDLLQEANKGGKSM
jgi:hypothetical protein